VKAKNDRYKPNLAASEKSRAPLGPIPTRRPALLGFAARKEKSMTLDTEFRTPTALAPARQKFQYSPCRQRPHVSVFADENLALAR
jgi:hypothetical protein